MEWLGKTVCCDSSEVCSSPEDENAEVWNSAATIVLSFSPLSVESEASSL